MYIVSYKLNNLKKFFVMLSSLIVLSISIVFVFSKNKSLFTNAEETKVIKYVEFNPTYEILKSAMKEDIKSHRSNDEFKINWIHLLSYLATKYGGIFKKYDKKDLESYVNKVKKGESPEKDLHNEKLYNYYLQAYEAILSGFLGETEYKDKDGNLVKSYGLKVRSPIAKGYSFSHYDDFGARRTFGYSRPHLGHDMFCPTGTPVVAVEDGYVEILGWNRYGGWRIGIRSHDQKRYWYYAHLRKDKPFKPGLEEGMNVKAGDIIGYVGRTGYSSKENVNNIKRSHLHIGLQLIFDESQKESTNEIWINLYNIIKLLF